MAHHDAVMVHAQPVAVGIDGSPESWAALHLGIREARLRGRTVRAVYADTLSPRAAELVDEALARAQGAPVPVEAQVVPGSPARVLLRESAISDLLVVGHRGRGAAPDLLLGSVAGKLAGQSVCPLLIAVGSAASGRSEAARAQPAPPARIGESAVKRPEDRGESGSTGADRPTGDVVVGVDGQDADHPAVGFAFEEAALRGTDLVALHAWQGRVTELDDMLPPVYEPSRAEEHEARLLAAALDGWRAKYPGVVVRQRLVRARAARTLVEASAWAQLVVIGANRRGAPGLMFWSVTRALLQHAACPVAVVHGG